MIDGAEHATHAAQDRPIFVSIETTAFSGATLLALLLSAHPQIVTIGEMNGLIAREDPDSYLCSCGQRIKRCAFWQAVADAMRERGFPFDPAHFDTELALGGPPVIQRLRKRRFRRPMLNTLRDALCDAYPGERQRVRRLVARNAAFVESVLDVTGGRVFVDTSKDRLRLPTLRRFSALDLRAIHLVRDVRGVVASRLRRGAAIDTREAARQWATLHDRIERTLAGLPPDKRLLVRYEALCRDASDTLARLDRFCGVDPALRSADLWPQSHHIIGNAMRLTQRTAISVDERWRAVLSEDQLAAIRLGAGTQGWQYGYQARSESW
ncbi:MAG TPA: sulfotransferase [Herpetosiphonaceae bacterium]